MQKLCHDDGRRKRNRKGVFSHACTRKFILNVIWNMCTCDLYLNVVCLCRESILDCIEEAM